MADPIWYDYFQLDGVRVGQWSDLDALTGCTVFRFPDGTVGSGEIRGSAPATREFALLDPTCTVEQVHAAFLSGGSAFGLAVGDGVMEALEADGVGFEVGSVRVPIVVGCALFDLGIGDSSVRPGAVAGRTAAGSASSAAVHPATVGAGTGARTGKWSGIEGERGPGGLGAAMVSIDDLRVGAVVAVNAVGWIGSGPPDLGPPSWSPGANTTIGVVITNANLTKLECHRLARAGHDGLARAIDPVHTAFDGDAVIAAATGSISADVDLIIAWGARVVERAIQSVETLINRTG